MRRAFTIVELLIVVVIIALLASIGLYVGRMVSEGGKARATQNTLQILDQVLNEYQTAKGGAIPPAVLIDGMGDDFPMFDGRVAGNPFTLATTPNVNPSVSLFLAQARSEAGAVDQALSKIDPKYIERTTFIDSSWGHPRLANGAGDMPGVVIKDGWGRPLRFVHPTLQGAYGPGFRKDTASTSASTFVSQPRPYFVISRMPIIEMRRAAWPFNPTARNSGDIGDADQGKCTGNSPYFYSCGPDGDPGTHEDNIYSNKKPTFDSDIRQGNSAS